MGKFFEEMPEFLIDWLLKQKMFWVATAPENGTINVSPKGVEGSFHVVGPRKVWYEDLSGSGVSMVSFAGSPHLTPRS